MKVQGYVFGALAAFFAIVATVYWLLSEEPAGSTALALTAGMAFMISFYLLFIARRLPPQPEDRLDAEIDEGHGEVGFFSPHSVWPLWVGASAAIFVLGLAFGVWLALIGAVLAMISVVGFVFQYYKSEPVGDHVE